MSQQTRAENAAKQIRDLAEEWSCPLSDVVDIILDAMYEEQPKPVHHQVSGPRCKNCYGFTTWTRAETHGLCMKCMGELIS